MRGSTGPRSYHLDVFTDVGRTERARPGIENLRAGSHSAVRTHDGIPLGAEGGDIYARLSVQVQRANQDDRQSCPQGTSAHLALKPTR